MLEKTFNVICKIPAAMRALRVAFSVSEAGIDFSQILEADITFRKKLDNLEDFMRKENTEAGLVFALEISSPYPDSPSERLLTWNDFFELLNDGLNKTEHLIETLNNPKETASLGRIQYHVGLLEQWYRSQDRRMSPFFDSSARINGIESELKKFFPKDNGMHAFFQETPYPPR